MKALRTVIRVTSLAAMVALGSLVALQHKFGIDDFSYLAYLTAWQHASRLSFQEVFFNTGTIDAIRFWLAMFPMVFLPSSSQWVPV